MAKSRFSPPHPSMPASKAPILLKKSLSTAQIVPIVTGVLEDEKHSQMTVTEWADIWYVTVTMVTVGRVFVCDNNGVADIWYVTVTMVTVGGWFVCDSNSRPTVYM